MMRSNRKSETQIILNVYDLAPQNRFLYDFGFGLYHSGVQIGTLEYTFGSGGGIITMTPRNAPGAQFRESIVLGVYSGTSSDIDRIVSELRKKYTGDSYNLLSRNCNHFANAFVYNLLQIEIPGYINRMAELGSMVSCLLPPAIVGESPVANTSSGSSQYNDSYHSTSSLLNDSSRGYNSRQGSQGTILGGSTRNSIDTEDQKAKIRQATLSRLSGTSS